jgi:hypothetical protein
VRVLLGALAGVPIGLVLGRVVWSVVAWGPGRRAARVRLAEALRSE